MVKTYSLRKDGLVRLSPNFTVREFKCKGGGDEILICTDLVTAIDNIRSHFGNKPISISSAYRDPVYNAKIKGAKSSQHLNGKAVDIRIAGVTPRAIAQYADKLGMGGVGLYEYAATAGKTGFTHVDTRKTPAKWLQTDPNGGAKTVTGFDSSSTGSNVKLWSGCRGDAVRALQEALKSLGYDPGAIDGTFGRLTEDAVRKFQSTKGLTVDGIVGLKTGMALRPGT